MWYLNEILEQKKDINGKNDEIQKGLINNNLTKFKSLINSIVPMITS